MTTARESAALLLAVAAIAFAAWSGAELRAAARIMRENRELVSVREHQLEAELEAHRAARRQQVSIRWEIKPGSNVWGELFTPRELAPDGKIEDVDTFINRHVEAYRRAQQFGG